jgi:hypothetical protein
MTHFGSPGMLLFLPGFLHPRQGICQTGLTGACQGRKTKEGCNPKIERHEQECKSVGFPTECTYDLEDQANDDSRRNEEFYQNVPGPEEKRPAPEKRDFKKCLLQGEIVPQAHNERKT